jgi:hypothetical protein
MRIGNSLRDAAASRQGGPATAALGGSCVKTWRPIFKRGNRSTYDCRTRRSRVFYWRKSRLASKSRAAAETNSPRPLQSDVFTQPWWHAAVAAVSFPISRFATFRCMRIPIPGSAHIPPLQPMRRTACPASVRTAVQRSCAHFGSPTRGHCPKTREVEGAHQDLYQPLPSKMIGVLSSGSPL